MPDSDIYMQRAIELARLGGVKTKTNPNVGAVLVHADAIIGEGYHKQYGGSHAEIEALTSVSDDKMHLIADSTMYVTLEPCCIHSKTPPCTDAIIKAGIKKLVVGCRDPHKPMNGQSIDLLRAEGIEVLEAADFKSQCEDLIRPFIAHLQKRPYVILKWAQTLDNYIGKRDQQLWLSNDFSKVKSHTWRSEVDAILVGYNTVVTDDPKLTTRLVNGPNPMRIVLDRDASLNSEYAVCNKEASTLIINGAGREEQLDSIRYHTIGEGDNFVAELLAYLFEEGVCYLMVEGGTKTINKFINAKLWDEARIIKVHKQLRSGIAAPRLGGRRFKCEFMHSDRIDYVYPS
ncbi:MAG: bifunctional diaminohydroxyphosphoribosylaminopyrimidine deaminase/5-amino-6-(5-phosphoribosylamino)uracil reductase RibD [Saprospiraceae bacterium]|nr:bifunctional diaminohydroxyphosphoribosylaminopyrimidine deaminase/5-amino-6-(5-phosphoribosylamino)uracil reductase RibD [Saprospiraceae bacterium]